MTVFTTMFNLPIYCSKAQVSIILTVVAYFYVQHLPVVHYILPFKNPSSTPLTTYRRCP